MLELWLDQFICDIVLINEHWLAKEEITMYVPSNFSLASYYCRQLPYIRGGSCIFIKEWYEYQQIDVSEFCLVYVLEISTIFIPKLNLIVATIYRTPDSDVLCFFNLFENFLKYICGRFHKSKVVISSDFNVDLNKNTNETSNFLNLLRSYNLYCLNKDSTREKACLDNIVSNMVKNAIDCKVIQPSLSDHLGVLASFNDLEVRNFLKPIDKESIIKKVRVVNVKTIASFRDRLAQADWFHLSTFLNINEAYDHFMYIMTSSYNECCYFKNVRADNSSRSDKRWFTIELKQIREKVHFLYDSLKKTKVLYMRLIMQNCTMMQKSFLNLK